MKLQEEIIQKTDGLVKAINWLRAKSNKNKDLEKYISDLEAFLRAYELEMVDRAKAENNALRFKLKYADVVIEYQLLLAEYEKVKTVLKEMK